MKLRNTITAIIVGSLLTAGFAFAAEAAAKAAACCTKATKDGKPCTHECCVKAAKDGNNCTTCGGSGKAEVKKAEQKK
jgi:hypothetical protein